jgi:hypothetical protein
MDTSPEERVAKLNETVAAVKALLAGCDNPAYVWETVRSEMLPPLYTIESYEPTPDDHPVQVGETRDGLVICLFDWWFADDHDAVTKTLTPRQVRRAARDLLEAADRFEYGVTLTQE